MIMKIYNFKQLTQIHIEVVVNIPESEMSGVEIEFTGLISDSLTFDMGI